jgi:hypothetical protein
MNESPYEGGRRSQLVLAVLLTLPNLGSNDLPMHVVDIHPLGPLGPLGRLGLPGPPGPLGAADG